MIPGGFSAGDEPDGSGKFIAAFFCNPRLKEAVPRTSRQTRRPRASASATGSRRSSSSGSCPGARSAPSRPKAPRSPSTPSAATFRAWRIRKSSRSSRPGSLKSNIGDVHTVPISHGEGRFVGAGSRASGALFANGQVATRYVDADGAFADDHGRQPERLPLPPSRASRARTDGCSAKWATRSARGENVAKNIPGNKDQKIFEAGVEYFR